MKVRIKYISLAVDDLEKSMIFYNEALGLENGMVMASPDNTRRQVQFMLDDNLSLLLSTREQMASDAEIPVSTAGNNAVLFTFRVETREEVDDVIDRVRKAGALTPVEVRDDYWGANGYFIDPDGHFFEIAWYKDS